jgi:hypothetical protein
VPPSASSKRPSFRFTAPVKAPRSWPKSSDSSSASGMAAQEMVTKGPAARRLPAWRARATSSLPVPDSPSTSTVASVAATLRTCSRTRRIGSESPTMPEGSRSRAWSASMASARPRSVRAPRRSRAISAAFSTRARSTSGGKGFSMKSVAPARMASTAVAMVPWAETTSTVASGSRSRRRRTTSRPSTGTMRRSVTTTSAGRRA